MADNARPPVAVRIVRPYDTEEAFLESELETVGKTSVILIGAHSRPTGVILRFEVTLATGATILRGEGRVLAHKESAFRGQPGLALRFTRLDPKSKALVDRAAAIRDARLSGDSLRPAPVPPPPSSSTAVTVASERAPASMPPPSVASSRSAPPPSVNPSRLPIPRPSTGRPPASRSNPPRSVPPAGDAMAQALTSSTPPPPPSMPSGRPGRKSDRADKRRSMQPPELQAVAPSPVVPVAPESRPEASTLVDESELHADAPAAETAVAHASEPPAPEPALPVEAAQAAPAPVEAAPGEEERPVAEDPPPIEAAPPPVEEPRAPEPAPPVVEMAAPALELLAPEPAPPVVEMAPARAVEEAEAPAFEAAIVAADAPAPLAPARAASDARVLPPPPDRDGLLSRLRERATRLTDEQKTAILSEAR